MRPRVLLLNPPGDRLYIRDQYCSLSSKANYCWGPIDLIVLSGVLSPHADLRVIDATVLGMSRRECAMQVLSSEFDVLIFLTGHCSVADDLSFIKCIRREHEALVLTSGDIALGGDEGFLDRYPFVDGVIRDFTSSGIVDYVKQGRAATSPIPDLRYRTANGQIVEPPPCRRQKTFTIPVPRHELFPLEKYRLPYSRHAGFASIVTSYGCPFPCSFCIAGTLPFKYRPVDNVIEELRYVRSLGVREVFVKDSMFEANRANAMALCQAMVDERMDLSWSCSCRADTIDEELLGLMRRAGCYFVAMGVESGSARVLKRTGKGITLGQAVAAFKQCKQMGFGTAAFFLVGLPGETRRTVHETVQFARELDPDYISFAMVAPDYGTELWREVVRTEHQCRLARASDRSRIAFPSCDAMTPQEIEGCHRYAVRAFYLRPSTVLKYLRKARSVRQLGHLMRDAFALVRNYFVPGR